MPGFPFEFGPGGPQQQPRGGLGSGFVWDEEGHIVTNNHVIEEAGEVSVVFADGSITTGEVIGADPQSDLAVVKVDPAAHPLIPVEVADSTRVRVGEIVAAIGNPFGEQSTLTTGIVSALGRTLPAGQPGAGPVYFFLSAAVLLFGAELNAVLLHRRAAPPEQAPPKPPSAPRRGQPARR